MVKQARAAQPKAAGGKQSAAAKEQALQAEYRTQCAVIEKESHCALLLLRGLAQERKNKPQTMRERILGAKPLLLPTPVRTAMLKLHKEIMGNRQGYCGGDTQAGNMMMDDYMRVAAQAAKDAKAAKWAPALHKFCAIMISMRGEDYDSVADNEAWCEGANWSQLWRNITETGKRLLEQSNAALGLGPGNLARQVLIARMGEMQAEANNRLCEYEDPPVEIKIFAEDIMTSGQNPAGDDEGSDEGDEEDAEEEEETVQPAPAAPAPAAKKANVAPAAPARVKAKAAPAAPAGSRRSSRTTKKPQRIA